MINVIEDKRNEFKMKLTDDFEKEVIAFLNTEGGNLFIGIDDKGNITNNIKNIDLLQRTIKDRIKDNIRPSTLGLFDVVVNEKNNHLRTYSTWYDSLVEKNEIHSEIV